MQQVLVQVRCNMKPFLFNLYILQTGHCCMLRLANKWLPAGEPDAIDMVPKNHSLLFGPKLNYAMKALHGHSNEGCMAMFFRCSSHKESHNWSEILLALDRLLMPYICSRMHAIHHSELKSTAVVETSLWRKVCISYHWNLTVCSKLGCRNLLPAMRIRCRYSYSSCIPEWSLGAKVIICTWCKWSDDIEQKHI